MGGLNVSLNIGIGALDATQAALNATSNNIANSNTAGYTREVARLSENAQTVTGDEVNGGGVTLNGLQSVRDELINTQIQQQTSAQSSADTQSSSLQQIQNLFTTSGTDIASALTTFSKSLTQLSANSTNSATQQSVLSAGQNLATAFNTTSNGLTSAKTAADAQVTSTVAQINSLTTQIAQLNGQVAQLTSTGQDGGAIQDQRDELVQQLSSLTGVSITQSGSNGETITTGDGTPLVMGSQSFALQTSASSSGTQVLDSSGNNITASNLGGTLGGAIQIRDQVIPTYMSQLNTLASQLSTAFNSAQAQGYESTGAAGQNFFAIATTPTGAAAGMSVAITDPAKIAVSSDGSTGSNGNVANLSAAFTNTLPSGQTPANAYANLVFQVGNDASNASTQSTAIGQNLLQLQNQQSSVSGVNIDEETTNLIRFQTAYEAAARIVSTVQALNTATMSMVSA
jgi:flagellar hook-associated protein 1 FlgK